MAHPAAIEIASYDLRTAPDDALTVLHRLETAFEAEVRPGEPPVPFAAYQARYRAQPSYVDSHAWLAGSGGAPIGAATVEVARTGSNEHVIEAWVYAKPEARRQGLARRLLALIIEAADREQRTVLWAYTASSIPAGAAFLERVGAVAGLVERGSELDLVALDRSLLDEWIEEGPARAGDYDLLLIEDDIPDEFLEPFAALYSVTNTAPHDDLEMEDEHRTPEQLRDRDRSRREAGTERVLYMARHRPTGTLAGWTELGRHPADPERVQQYWTAVHPDHRGHALGKWLKAANIARALERWPGAKKIVTGNAYSNDAMLGINDALGFRETVAWTVWQAPVERVRDYLGRA